MQTSDSGSQPGLGRAKPRPSPRAIGDCAQVDDARAEAELASGLLLGTQGGALGAGRLARRREVLLVRFQAGAHLPFAAFDPGTEFLDVGGAGRTHFLARRRALGGIGGWRS